MGYRIQKIYVGTHQVRPAWGGTTLSIDFRNKTQADVENAWWSIIWSPTFQTNGVQANDYAFIYQDVDLSNATKLTMVATGYVEGGDWAKWCVAWWCKDRFAWTNPYVAWEARGEVSNGYKGAYIIVNSSERVRSNLYAVSGDSTLTLIVDCQTWDVSCTVENQGNTQTATTTLTSSELADLKANATRLGWTTVSSNTSRLYTLDITVE